MFVYERYLPKELEILGSLYFQLICNYLKGVQFLSTIHPHQTTASKHLAVLSLIS